MTKQKTNKNCLRGNNFNNIFFENFKKSIFYTEVYLKHQDVITIGVRNGYINLYHNCNSIAKIRNTQNDKLKAEISTYYLGENGESKYVTITDDQFVINLKLIFDKSSKRETSEKKAQQALILQNNQNIHSKWFCFDLEYKKGYSKDEERNGNFQGRFDIVAISKDAPHQIAFIELKYGADAIGGKSGIRKHIQDFVEFNGTDKQGSNYFESFTEETISILRALEMIGVPIPQSLQGVQALDVVPRPEFYVVTFDNNCVNGSTPQMTMSGYLFADKRWNCKKVSQEVSQKGDYFELTQSDKNFNPVFLFSEQTLENLHIDDILDRNQYTTIVSKILTYKQIEEEKAVVKFETTSNTRIFENAKNKGVASWKDSKSGKVFEKASRKVLVDTDRTKNLFKDIREDAIQYMELQDIAWWHMEKESENEVTAHIMSSQVACLNHLFLLRNNETAIKDILKSITNIDFDKILPLDNGKSLISFEFVHKNDELLNEKYKGARRGKLWTSIDAFIKAKRDDEIWIFPIEWKYTEEYEKMDKTNETRLKCYQKLIEQSMYLKTPQKGIPHSVYFQEPYYELMRQTLLCEQIINEGLATRLMHICVVPKENGHLNFSIKKDYVPLLKEPDMFKIVSPNDLLKPIRHSEKELFTYLKNRYWE